MSYYGKKESFVKAWIGIALPIYEWKEGRVGEWRESVGGEEVRAWAWWGVAAAGGVAWERAGECGPDIALPNHGSRERLI